MKTKIFFIVGLISLLLIVSGCNTITGKVVDDSKKSVPVQEKSPTIEITGSDTMLQVVSSLAEAYKQKNPLVRISVTGGGSGTGIASLLNGNVPIADSSRKITDAELQQAKDKGLDIIEVPIGRDTLSVIVNPSNPVRQLTIEQLSKIYKGEIKNWKDVGGSDMKITLYGRQSTSGTYTYFRDEVVKGEYSQEMRNMEGNQAIVDAVSQDKSGVGYVGVGYIVDSQKKPITSVNAINVAKTNNSEYVTPLDETKIDQYPISRELFQYIAQKPPKESIIYNYLMFVLSNDGQKVVENSGFIQLDINKKGDIIQRLN